MAAIIVTAAIEFAKKRRWRCACGATLEQNRLRGKVSVNHRHSVRETRPRRRGIGEHPVSQPNAVIKNQDNNGDRDPNDDCGGKLRWLVTARHVDTSNKDDAVGSPPAPLQPCTARAHSGAVMGFNKRKMEDAPGRRPRRKPRRAARPNGRSLRMPSSW
jgi:hypothetical protein